MLQLYGIDADIISPVLAIHRHFRHDSISRWRWADITSLGVRRLTIVDIIRFDY